MPSIEVEAIRYSSGEQSVSLVGSSMTLTVSELAAIGVRRLSVGGALARAAWGGFMRAAQSLAADGRFDGLPKTPTGTELDSFFAAAERR
jgi:2-methylisocitrate lyase-like PEP mutase family enzyme